MTKGGEMREVKIPGIGRRKLTKEERDNLRQMDSNIAERKALAPPLDGWNYDPEDKFTEADDE